MKTVFKALFIIISGLLTDHLVLAQPYTTQKIISTSAIWESHPVRPALSPKFYLKNEAKPENLILGAASGDSRNLHGIWKTTLKVEGGEFYSFSIVKRTENIESITQATPVFIHWINDQGNTVLSDKNYFYSRLGLETFGDPDGDWPWAARPEIPLKEIIQNDGSIRVSAVFQAPPNATHGRVELHFRWSARASVEWSGFRMEKIEKPTPGKIKLAAAFGNIGSHTGAANGKEAAMLFAPLIKEAKSKGASLVCLPEFLDKKYTKFSYEKVAEPVPSGGATGIFIQLAKENDIYIVAGLVEKDGDTLYNTSILVGPEGYIGKYRKVGITAGEANDEGITPGREYPVFDTKIGKIGMMICLDLYFPEIALNLRRNGAEIIAMPIAGGNPILAQARAIENQVYLVTSTYDTRKNWIKTGIYDYDGKLLDFTETPGGVAIAEVMISDLPRYWGHLGDLKGEISVQEP